MENPIIKAVQEFCQTKVQRGEMTVYEAEGLLTVCVKASQQKEEPKPELKEA